MFSFLKKSKGDVPFYEEKRFFKTEEAVLFGRLKRALPTCHIFPKVELAMLIDPISKAPKTRQAELKDIEGRLVDFAIFDPSLGLLCVVELEHESGQPEPVPRTSDFLKTAGIKTFRWSAVALPSAEQILKVMEPFSSMAAIRPDVTSHTLIRPLAPEPAQHSVAAAPAAPPPPQPTYGLTVRDLESLTPHGHIRKGYPHVWQRICLFGSEPKHMEKYLASLSIQDRGVERSGFPQEVIIEITDIQHANERFVTLPDPRLAWKAAFKR